ncbi:MAG: RluA family pseudouridine synthase [Deltaproteobacteria bacterium]|nr:RluA family pseudouridine synthase [Deltaproteobacteria bacterium]
MRLDVYLAQKTGRARHQIQKIIREGKVVVEGQAILKPSLDIRGDEKIDFELPPEEILTAPKPEAIPLDILFEDDQIAVVNKPADLVVHPALKNQKHTLVNALLARYGDLPVVDDPLKPGIVHRLDKGTSGCLVVARTKEALLNLQKQFKARTVEKIYLALVVGTPDAEGRIDKAIGWHPKKRNKISSRTRKGKEAITEWKVLETFEKKFTPPLAHGQNVRSADNASGGVSWVEIRLHTGRTHQIRVHFTEAGYPIVGDPTYGRRAKVLQDWIQRPALHAWRLGLHHPITNQWLTFEAPLPEDLQNLLENLKKGRC